MDNQNNLPKTQEQQETLGKTPSEIIHYHMEHPNEPITDEEIRQAVITSEAPPAPAKTTDEDELNKEIEDDKKNKEDRDHPIQSSYDVLGG